MGSVRKQSITHSSSSRNEQPKKITTGSQRLTVPRPRKCLPAYVLDPYEDEYSDDVQDPDMQSTVAKPSAAHIPPSGTHVRSTSDGDDSDSGKDNHSVQYYSRWRKFILETGPKMDPDVPSWIVPDGWYDRHRPIDDERDLYEEKKALGKFKRSPRPIWQRARRTLLRSAWVPLILRWMNLFLCVAAIALGATILKTQSASPKNEYIPSSSPRMAIIVDSVAILYLLYATFDEYFSPPLGLRPAKSKVGILLLDLFFICFSSVNTTLAFTSLIQYGSTYSPLFMLQQSLAAVLVVTVTAWILSLVVSILRVVERIEH